MRCRPPAESSETPFAGAKDLVDGCQIVTKEAAYGQTIYASVPIEVFHFDGAVSK